jgi:xanthine/uracil permease
VEDARANLRTRVVPVLQNRPALVEQLPWFLTVAVIAAGNGLTHNPFVRLAADGECVLYGALLVVNYRELALLPPWRRRFTGKVSGVFVIVIGVMLTAVACYQLFT